MTDKELVLTKLMGISSDKLRTPGVEIIVRKWHPNSDEKALCADWQKIYNKMDAELWKNYLEILHEMGTPLNFGGYHMVPPSRRWEALVKALKEAA